MNANNIKLLNIPFLSSEAKLNSFNLIYVGPPHCDLPTLIGWFP